MPAQTVTRLALSLIEGCLDAATAASVGEAFFESLKQYGARAIFSRTASATGETIVLSRISPAGWEDIYTDRRFATANYLNRELPRRRQAFVWSEVTLANRAEERLAAAVREFGVADGIAIPFHTVEGLGVTSLGFERLGQLSPDERQAIEMAGLVLHDRMRLIGGPQGGSVSILTQRERDCVGLMVLGNRDADIADRLGVSIATVLTHMNSAKRKLNARTRAHAAVIAISQGQL